MGPIYGGTVQRGFGRPISKALPIVMSGRQLHPELPLCQPVSTALYRVNAFSNRFICAPFLPAWYLILCKTPWCVRLLCLLLFLFGYRMPTGDLGVLLLRTIDGKPRNLHLCNTPRWAIPWPTCTSKYAVEIIEVAQRRDRFHRSIFPGRRGRHCRTRCFRKYLVDAGSSEIIMIDCGIFSVIENTSAGERSYLCANSTLFTVVRGIYA